MDGWGTGWATTKKEIVNMKYKDLIQYFNTAELSKCEFQRGKPTIFGLSSAKFS